MLTSERLAMTAAPASLIKEVTLRGFLSFAPAAASMKLTSLNVVIGPNGSGKSNLIEALSVLRAVPKDLPLPIRRGGGVSEWLWKDAREEQADHASIEVLFAENTIAQSPGPAVRYRLAFGAQADNFVVLDERIENEKPSSTNAKAYFYFGYENGRPMLNIKSEQRELKRADIDPTQSILSQRRDPDTYPELTRVADLLGKIVIYRSWEFGPDSALRASCLPDVRTDILSERFDNLPARLAALKRTVAVKRRMLQFLADLAPGFDDIEVIPEGGQLQLYLSERGRMFPARRLSDGTLRFLALLAILLDPSPGPLIAIEEPELGLHFDMMPKIAELLRDAATRTQLIVTTHSDALIDALNDTPESVMVCEKDRDGTRVRRLRADELKEWLHKYSLGTLWTRGDIGGTRW